MFITYTRFLILVTIPAIIGIAKISDNTSVDSKSQIHQKTQIDAISINGDNLNKSLMPECISEFTNIQVTNTALNECGNAGTVTFSADLGVITDPVVNFTLPSDFQFAGNVVGGTVNSIDPISITLDVNSASIAFSFDMQARCGASDTNTCLLYTSPSPRD